MIRWQSPFDNACSQRTSYYINKACPNTRSNIFYVVYLILVCTQSSFELPERHKKLLIQKEFRLKSKFNEKNWSNEIFLSHQKNVAKIYNLFSKYVRV
ncbi:hypothetical protein BpHYR1_006851 [Brachionus plicatilis]|uniref:Uncharacterized protein n=1 Tax=Brachionus plicatilis TaxID=10195 RepID=A0A3M7PAB3_BRAPC|nr:hypothetical protein BpHYR1_006851 [Brachionus plicatilis]